MGTLPAAPSTSLSPHGQQLTPLTARRALPPPPRSPSSCHPRSPAVSAQARSRHRAGNRRPVPKRPPGETEAGARGRAQGSLSYLLRRRLDARGRRRRLSDGGAVTPRSADLRRRRAGRSRAELTCHRLPRHLHRTCSPGRAGTSSSPAPSLVPSRHVRDTPHVPSEHHDTPYSLKYAHRDPQIYAHGPPNIPNKCTEASSTVPAHTHSAPRACATSVDTPCCPSLYLS